jgi:hypothetical protein
MDVPLLYELVAARQIIKHARVGAMPVVIVTHEDVVDPAPIMEVGPRRDEYVTRLSDYQGLQHLLDYLLPVLPSTADAQPTRSLNLSKGARMHLETSPSLDASPLPQQSNRTFLAS